MSDPIQTVRDFLTEFDPTEIDIAHSALDRIEAVVKAARAVQHGANIRVLYRALAALDSQEEGTP